MSKSYRKSSFCPLDILWQYKILNHHELSLKEGNEKKKRILPYSNMRGLVYFLLSLLATGGRAERDGKEYFCELKREERRDVRNEHWVDDDYKGPKEGMCVGAAVVELVLYTGENIRAVVVWSNVVGGQWRLVVIYVSDEPPFRYIPPATLKATRVSQSPRYGAHGGESRKPETRLPLVGPLLTFGQSTFVVITMLLYVLRLLKTLRRVSLATP